MVKPKFDLIFIVAATILGLFLSLVFYVVFGFSNITDLVVAQSIPPYLNADSWYITSSIGFPDGVYHARIGFSTGDPGSSVLDFYREQLIPRGWKIEEDRSKALTNPGLLFKKDTNLGSIKVEIVKTQSIYAQSKTGWIFITHGINL
jgi:hypothetical protein